MKKLVLLYVVTVFGICCSMNLFGQSDWIWAKSAGAGGLDEGFSVATDTFGNVFVTGFFNGQVTTFGTTTLTNADFSGNTDDLYIAKYDSSGNVLWAKSAGGISDEISWSVDADVNGNVLVTGFFQSPSITFGTTTLISAGVTNIFIVKYDPAGNVLWAKSETGPGNGVGYSVSSDVAGNVFMTGFFSGPTITFGTTTLTTVGGKDIFIVKYDPMGNELWAKSAGGAGEDFSYSLSADAAGNIYITGDFEGPTISFGTTTLNNAGIGNVFIAKYDMNGNVLWANSGIGTNYAGGLSISAALDSSVFVTGYFASPTITFGSNTLTNSGPYSLFITKFDANGNVLWAKSAVAANGDKGFSVSADNIGNVFLYGQFNGPNITFGTTTLTCAICGDPIFIVKYDSNGNVLCATALTSGGDDFSAVAADRFGNAYVCSDFLAAPLIVGSDTLTSIGQEDIYVAKYRCYNVEDVNEIVNGEIISIFPNPSNGIFNLELNSFANATLEIYNLFGKIIFQSTINNPTSTIDLSNEANGIYFVVVKTEKESFIQKIFINK